MHVPRTDGERVGTIDGPGEWTGESGQFGEHFVIALDDGEEARLHKEDIYPSQDAVPTRRTQR